MGHACSARGIFRNEIDKKVTNTKTKLMAIFSIGGEHIAEKMLLLGSNTTPSATCLSEII